MPQPADTIGGWTTAELQKVVRDMIQLLPPTNLTGLTVDDLVVPGSLTVSGTVSYTRLSTFYTIGASGQPAFQNSAVAAGAPYQAPAFIKTEDGWVRLRGSAKSGTIGSPWFTLPPGYRPANTVAFAVAGSGLTGIVEIASTGTVTPLSPLTNTRVSFDGIQFKAA